MVQVAGYLFPLLWSVWILLALFRSTNKSLGILLLQWLAVDLLLLFCFLGLWYQDDNWFQTEAANEAEQMIIAPLFVPLAYATKRVSENLYTHTFGSIAGLEDKFMQYGMGDVITNWLMMTIAILPETLLLVIVSQLIFALRVRVSRKHLLSTPKKVF